MSPLDVGLEKTTEGTQRDSEKVEGRTAKRRSKTRKGEQGVHRRPVPGVIALLGVPGGLLGVAGGTPTSLLSASTPNPTDPSLPLAGSSCARLSCTRATSFAAFRAASPKGLEESIRVSARRRSRGSVAVRLSVEVVVVAEEGAEVEEEEGKGVNLERDRTGAAPGGGMPGGGGRVRWARESERREKRWSRSSVMAFVSSSATVRAACSLSSYNISISLFE